MPLSKPWLTWLSVFSLTHLRLKGKSGYIWQNSSRVSEKNWKLRAWCQQSPSIKAFMALYDPAPHHPWPHLHPLCSPPVHRAPAALASLVHTLATQLRQNLRTRCSLAEYSSSTHPPGSRCSVMSQLTCHQGLSWHIFTSEPNGTLLIPWFFSMALVTTWHKYIVFVTVFLLIRM